MSVNGGSKRDNKGPLIPISVTTRVDEFLRMSRFHKLQVEWSDKAEVTNLQS